jgi:hypothetical protein
MWKIAYLCVLSIALPVSAEVYRWVDNEGKVHYGDHAPDGQRDKATSVKIKTLLRRSIRRQRKRANNCIRLKRAGSANAPSRRKKPGRYSSSASSWRSVVNPYKTKSATIKTLLYFFDTTMPVIACCGLQKSDWLTVKN